MKYNMVGFDNCENTCTRGATGDAVFCMTQLDWDAEMTQFVWNLSIKFDT